MTDRTSNIAATSCDVIEPAAQSATVHTLPVTTQAPAQPKPKALSSKARKQQEAGAKAASIGDTIARIGDEIGHYTVDHDLAKGQLQETVESLLRVAMEQGLVAEMLKAPTKKEPRECYTLLVDAMNAPRIANDMPELKNTARDNYMSRIRKFVEARGAVPLDLFGNYATKAAKSTSTKSSANDTSDEDETATKNSAGTGPAVKRGTSEQLIGLPALQRFLAAWMDANPCDSKNAALAEVRDMVADVNEHIEDILKTK
jgi:hypothetical protein